MRSAILLTLVVWNFCVAAPTRGENPAERTTEVSGQVVDASGAGVAGANLRALVHPAVADTQSDTSGRFKLTVPRSTYRVTVLATDDIGRMGIARKPSPQESEVEPADDLRIELGASKALTVAVVDHAGQPVAGARVGVLIDSAELPPVETSALGTAVLRVPLGATCRVVYARKLGQGFDYRLLESLRHPVRSPGWPADGRVELTLGPTRKVQIRAKEINGELITRISYRLWYLQKPGELEEFNLSYTSDLFGTKTNAEGVANFDDLPSWVSGRLPFDWKSDDKFVRKRIIWDPAKQIDGVVDVTLERHVSMSGRVEFADGTPAAGIVVKVAGAGHDSDSFHGQTTSREDGSFQIGVFPNELYMLGIDDSKWSANIIDGFVVRPGTPIENLKLTLQPATRVHGRVVMGKDRKPVAKEYVSLRQAGRNLSSLPGVELPNPDRLRTYIQPVLNRSYITDADGHYEFHVGPGEYTLGPSQVEVQKALVTNQPELTFDFEKPLNEKAPLTGSVVDAQSGQGIPRALITGIYRHHFGAGDLEFVTGGDGKFRGEGQLYPYPIALHAQSADGLLGGLLEIGPNDAEATIKVQELSKAAGQIIDEATGRPLANRKVKYGVRVHIGDDKAPWRDSFGGTTTTDAEGNFELTKLVAGGEYHINVPTDEHSSRSVGTVTIDSPLTKQLGKLVLKKPYQPPTLEERIAKALEGDPLEKYAAAQKNAQSYRQRVAILLIDPKADATGAFMKLRLNDKDVRKAMDQYNLVVVDATSEPAKALAKSLDLTIAASDGLPQFVVRDAEGAAVTVAEASEIALGGKIDKTRTIDLLRAHALEALDARTLLKDALAEARKSNRRVLVQQTAVWCPPCHRLGHYLEDQRAIWDKDYIWVRIDERWTNSGEVMDGIKAGYRGGIPWMAILDADGQSLATSNGLKGENIGFPSSPPDIDYFLKMLKDTSQRLSDDDLQKLRAGFETQ